MRTRLCSLGCALALLLLSVGVSAEEESTAPNDRTGPYVAFGLSGLLPTWDANEPGLDPDEKASLGITARAGYRITSWVALEAHYEYMDGQEVQGVLQSGEVRAHFITLNTRWILPIEGNTRPYALLGIGAAQYEVHNSVAGLAIGGSEWELAGRLGAGIESYIGRGVVLYVEATAIGSEGELLNEHFPQVSVGGGLQYRF